MKTLFVFILLFSSPAFAAYTPSANTNSPKTLVIRDASGNIDSTSIQATNLTTTGNGGVSGTLTVGHGGTGATTFSAGSLLLGNGGSAFSLVGPGTAGNVLQNTGSAWVSSVFAPFSSVIPHTNNALDLGSTSFTFRSVFFNAGTSLQSCSDTLGQNSITCLEVPYAATNNGLSIFTKSDATIDANSTGSINLIAGDKQDGTGNGGSIALQAGSSVGGTDGSIFIGAGQNAGGGNIDLTTSGGDIEFSGPINIQQGITWSDGQQTQGVMPRLFISASGSFTSLAGTPSVGGSQVTQATEVENLTVIASSFVCTTNPTFQVNNCATADIGCTTPTNVTSVTVTNAGQFFVSSTTGTPIPTGNFLQIKISAGACTLLTFTATATGYTF